MRIIIAGSRDFNDYIILDREVLRILRELKSEGFSTKRDDIIIVSGHATGADALGEKFADNHNLKKEIKPANWTLFGSRAGYIRNAEMASFARQDAEIGVLIACWNGVSKGTKDMIEQAKELELRVYIVNYTE